MLANRGLNRTGGPGTHPFLLDALFRAWRKNIDPHHLAGHNNRKQKQLSLNSGNRPQAISGARATGDRCMGTNTAWIDRRLAHPLISSKGGVGRTGRHETRTNTPVLVQVYYRVKSSDAATTIKIIHRLLTQITQTTQDVLVADDHASATICPDVSQTTLIIDNQRCHRCHRSKSIVLHGMQESAIHDDSNGDSKRLEHTFAQLFHMTGSILFPVPQALRFLQWKTQIVIPDAASDLNKFGPLPSSLLPAQAIRQICNRHVIATDAWDAIDCNAARPGDGSDCDQ